MDPSLLQVVAMLMITNNNNNNNISIKVDGSLYGTSKSIRCVNTPRLFLAVPGVVVTKEAISKNSTLKSIVDLM